MVTVARSEADEIPLIEEQVDNRSGRAHGGYRAEFVPGGERDALGKRFSLHPTRALPQFDHAYAKGYEATDHIGSRNVYAMCSPTTSPTATPCWPTSPASPTPNLVTMLGAGPVLCSSVNESRFVIFLERPAGVSLAEAMRSAPRLHEHKVIDHILLPAVKALAAMREKKASHGNICPANFIFIGETSMLGDCFLDALRHAGPPALPAARAADDRPHRPWRGE
ncbi:MAG: hypothetical protein WDN72_03410 [Alphaproteobacteria bacterium]